MALIADITGADVAASTDATGHESLGGDWALEQKIALTVVGPEVPLVAGVVDGARFDPEVEHCRPS